MTIAEFVLMYMQKSAENKYRYYVATNIEGGTECIQLSSIGSVGYSMTLLGDNLTFHAQLYSSNATEAQATAMRLYEMLIN